MQSRSIALIVNGGPNTSPSLRVALKTALELASAGARVKLILYMEASQAASENTSAILVGELKPILKKLVEKNIEVIVCSSCLAARGLSRSSLVRECGLHEIAKLILESDNTVVLP